MTLSSMAATDRKTIQNHKHEGRLWRTAQAVVYWLRHCSAPPWTTSKENGFGTRHMPADGGHITGDVTGALNYRCRQGEWGVVSHPGRAALE